MASCKDCVHFEVCISYVREAYKRAHLATPDLNSLRSLRCDDCEHFADRSRFVELPCKVGDKLYTIVRGYKIRKWIVTDIFISGYSPLNETVITAIDKEGSEHMRFAEHYLGNTVFLTMQI